MVSLNASPIGKTQTVKWIVGNQSEIENINSIGIKEGTVLTVLNSFYGSVIVALDNFRFAIDRDLAYRIKVG